VRRRRGLWVLGIVVAAATAVAAVALLGGFNEVPIEKLPVIELGETYEGSEVQTTITGTYLTSIRPGETFEADEGKQFFVVEASLLNTDRDTDVLDTGLLRILLEPDVQPADDPDGVAMDDGRDLDFLQPGLTVNALFFWVVPDTIEDGDEVVVGVFDRHVVEDPRFGDAGAYASEPVARVVTTIGPRQ